VTPRYDSLMAKGNRPAIEETLAPQRNFSISTAALVRAAAGPHAYMRRKRHIEDLRASLRETVAAAIARAGGDAPAARCALEGQAQTVRALRELNLLIVAHNRYYPIEANLPLDPVTRLELDHGRPYKPLPAVTLCDVLRDVTRDGTEALAACRAPSPVGKNT
jgi:hypothetical protein